MPDAPNSDTVGHEVDSFCPSCGRRFPAGVAECDEDGSALRPSGVGADLTGTTLRRKYLLLERLGQGAFGAVYRALHLLGRAEVAVKLLHADRDADPAVRKLFLREARAVMRVRSPHAVLVHDVDEDDEGRLFIVMELLAGHSLLDELRAQPSDPPRMTPAAVREVLLQLAAALDAAHAEGVVHRDVKPANVMVEPRPGGGLHLRLVDFGIARLATVAATETTELIGPTTGTPAFMSPEQALGKPVSGASDYYSLGAMAYLLLSGELPFQSETVQGLLMAHIAETLPRLDASHPELGLPDELVEVVAALMEKEPADRPGSRDDIAALLAPSRPEAPVPLPPPRRGRWPALVAVALLAACGVLAALLWPGAHTPASGAEDSPQVAPVRVKPEPEPPPAPEPAAAVVAPVPSPTPDGETVARPVTPGTTAAPKPEPEPPAAASTTPQKSHLKPQKPEVRRPKAAADDKPAKTKAKPREKKPAQPPKTAAPTPVPTSKPPPSSEPELPPKSEPKPPPKVESAQSTSKQLEKQAKDAARPASPGGSSKSDDTRRRSDKAFGELDELLGK